MQKLTGKVGRFLLAQESDYYDTITPSATRTTAQVVQSVRGRTLSVVHNMKIFSVSHTHAPSCRHILKTVVNKGFLFFHSEDKGKDCFLHDIHTNTCMHSHIYARLSKSS